MVTFRLITDIGPGGQAGPYHFPECTAQTPTNIKANPQTRTQTRKMIPRVLKKGCTKMVKPIYELPVTKDDIIVLQLALGSFSNKCRFLAEEDEDINEDEKETCVHILDVVSSIQFKLDLFLKMLQFNANTEHEEGEE